MTIKVQLKREVNGVMQQVNPITSEDCVILSDGKKLNEVIDFATTAEDFVDETIVIEENLVDRIESIDAQLSQDKQELQNQINNLVLESGGDSNLEVVQARGAFNVLNDRLNSVDLQITNVNNTISEATVNLFDKDDITVGYTLMTNVGTSTPSSVMVNSNGFYMNKKIPVKKGDIVRCNHTYVGLLIYDVNGVLRESKNGKINEFTVSAENANFLMISYGNYADGNYERFMITVNNEMPTEYQPYAFIYGGKIDNIKSEVTQIQKEVTNITHEISELKKTIIPTQNKNYDYCGMMKDYGKYYSDFNCNVSNAITEIKESRNGIHNKKISLANNSYIIATPVDKPTDNISVLFKLSEKTISVLRSINASIYIYASEDGLSDTCATRQLYTGKLYPDWYTYKCALSDLSKNNGFDLSNIKYVGLKIICSNLTDSIEIILNSVIVDSFMKPTVIMNFDGIYDTDKLVGGKLDVLKQNQIKSTVFVQETEASQETKKLWADMAGQGLSDFEMYSCAGNRSVMQSKNNPLEQYNQLVQGLENVRNDFLSGNITKYSASQSIVVDISIPILKKLGITMCRTAGYDYLSNFTKNDFLVGMPSLFKTTTFSTVKLWIDYAIEHGCCLSLFTHEVGNDDNDYGCSIELFTQTCEYIKEKVDNGELQTMTFNEFYDACIG